MKSLKKMVLKIEEKVKDLKEFPNSPWVKGLQDDTLSILARAHRSFSFDINTISKDDLMKIRGMGEKRTSEVIVARKTYGPGI